MNIKQLNVEFDRSSLTWVCIVCFNQSVAKKIGKFQGTIFLLINTLGALQLLNPENDTFKSKCGQIYQILVS